jgi:parallel beta-helix repeat protein
VGSSTGACIRVEASFVRVRDIEVSDCRPARAGIHVRGDRNLIEGMTIRDNEAGVVVAGGSGNRIIGNLMRDNSLMTVDNCNSEGSSEGDYGAYNVAVERASGTEIAHNYASGAVGSSCDYGIDGSMVEIFEGRDTDVHHNVSVGNAAFAEVGGAGSANQRFAYNQVTGDAEEIAGFVLHGGGTYAGAEGIVLLHNSVRLQGSRSIGLGCFEDCSPEILHARNNIFAAEVAVRSPAPFDDANNLYSGEVETDIGPSSLVGDPGFVDGPGVALTPGSRAVDAATTGSERDGRPVDGKPDIGALELRPKA